MNDSNPPAPGTAPEGSRRCTEPDCGSGQEPPHGFDTCDPCSWEAYLAEREHKLLDQIRSLEASLADADRTGPGPTLAALLDRFGPDSRLGMFPTDQLRAGDVFARPWAQVRAIEAAGGGAVCVFCGHDTEKALDAGAVFLVLRPGDTALACIGCGRDFTTGCAKDCSERFISEATIKAVFTEAGMHAPTGLGPA